MSESGAAESEEEEELDEYDLGIKSNPRSLRLSPRRKPAPGHHQAQASSKIRGAGCENGGGTGANNGSAKTGKGTRLDEASWAESPGVDSTAASSSSESACDVSTRAVSAKSSQACSEPARPKLKAGPMQDRDANEEERPSVGGPGQERAGDGRGSQASGGDREGDCRRLRLDEVRPLAYENFLSDGHVYLISLRWGIAVAFASQCRV